MPRVLVVDDNRLFCAGLASLISSRQGYEVVGVAGDGAEACRQALALQPDLVLMDISMPVMDGIEATRAIKRACPDTRVAMLTMKDDEPDLLAALAAGADGYLLKDLSPVELFVQAQNVLEGQPIVAPGLAGEVLSRMAQGKSELRQLSPREVEVLGLVARGASNKEIGAELGIAENTVKKHLSNLMDKLRMGNRTQLALYAQQKGLAGRQ